MLADEQASPEQIEALRRMTPEQRWRAAHRLYWTVRRHKAAFIRSQHPEWPQEQVQEEVRRIFMHQMNRGALEEWIAARGLDAQWKEASSA